MDDRIISMLILQWAKLTWGEVASNPQERAARMFEEAAETAQAMNLSEGECFAILARTFSRPKDDPHKEIGGLLVTVYGLCAVMNLDPKELLKNELNRMFGKTAKDLRDRHQAKVEAGTARPGLTGNTAKPNDC